jgi:hypothetical protein
MSRDPPPHLGQSRQGARKTSLTLPPKRSVFHLYNCLHTLLSFPLLPLSPTPSPCPSSRASSLTGNNLPPSPQPPGSSSTLQTSARPLPPQPLLLPAHPPSPATALSPTPISMPMLLPLHPPPPRSTPFRQLTTPRNSTRSPDWATTSTSSSWKRTS